MARSVNQIEDILLPIAYIIHLDSMALDGDALFFLQIHRVQHLGFHIPAAQCVRYLQHPVRQSAFPMIDMCYYAKIPRVVHISAAVADPYITCRINKPHKDTSNNEIFCTFVLMWTIMGNI